MSGRLQIKRQINATEKDMTEERALQLANAALFDMIGNPDWDKPCLAKHILAAVAEDRERCAKLVEEACAWTGGHGMPGTPSGHELAKLIRKQPNGQSQRPAREPQE